MASPFDNAAKDMAAEQAYGPIYSSQYADAQKSARANEMARRLGVDPATIEAQFPNMLAEDKVRRATEEARKNAAYAKIMSNWRLAPVGLDDEHLPKVAQASSDVIDASKLSLGSKIALYGSSILKSFPQASGQFYRMLQMGVDTLHSLSAKGSTADEQLPILSGWLDSAARSSEQYGKVAQTTSPTLNAITSGGQSFGPSIMAGTAALFGQPEAGGLLMGGLTAGQTYKQAKDQGASQFQAVNNALQQGAEETVFETLGGKLFKGFVDEGGNFLTHILPRQLLTEVATEIPTTWAQNLSQYVTVDRPQGNEDFGSFLKHTFGEDTLSTAIATVAMAGPMIGGSYGVHRAVNKLITRKVDGNAARTVDKVMEAAANSSTRQSNPSDFHEALNQLFEDSPAENLYVPGDKVSELFKQEEGPTLREDPFWSKYADQVDEATKLGGDVVIPLADAATHLAGTDQWTALRDHVRTSAKGASIAEANAKMKPEELDRLAAGISDTIKQAVPRVQYAQAKAAVKGFAEGFGYADKEHTDTVAGYVANWLVTRYNAEQAKGQQVGSISDYAQQVLPTVQKQLQSEYDKAAERDGTLGQRVLLDRKLSGEEQEDIAHFIADQTNGEFDANEVAGNIFGSVRPGLASPIGLSVQQVSIDPSKIETGKQTSASAVSNYAARSGATAPRILVEKVGKSWRLVEGGHRLAAAIQRGDTSIRALDMTGLRGDWAAWLNGDDSAVPGASLGEDYGQEAGPQGAGGDQAAAGSVRDAGRVRGGDELLAATARQELGLDQPLPGAPESLNVPGRGRVPVGRFRPAVDAARRYMRQAFPHRQYAEPQRYAKLDKGRAKRLANAFEELKHDPDGPLVRMAYEAMIAETLAQYQFIKQTGLAVDFIEDGQPDPYAASPRLAIMDVIENNHLWVFPTTGGFGQGEVADSPMLQPVDEYINGRQLLANDVFRIVHDYFGHIKEGHGFRAEGEENAWQSHAAMYSPLARRAMTTETRGQNSWLNFGPHGEANRNASSDETVFAPQKVALMPEWAANEGFVGNEQGTQEQLGGGDRLSEVGRQERLVRANEDGTGKPIDSPPVDEEGQVSLVHFGLEEGLTELDPGTWGRSGRWLPEEERMRIGVAPGRVYFGIGFGRKGGYSGEGYQRGHHPYSKAEVFRYDAKIPLDRLYDMEADPDGLKAKGRALKKNRAGRYEYGGHALSSALPGVDGASLYELLIRDAGYSGYWIKDPSIGMVAAVFDPVEVEQFQPTDTYDQVVEPSGFERAAPFLTPDEADRMREASKAKLAEIIDTLSSAEEMAAVAYAGRAKRGWYERSAQAIVDVFGIEDGTRFAALLAALSPQTSVEMNFYNALKIWTGWNNAGRPTDRKTIVDIMGENVAGNKGKGSVLNAWINNSFAALTSPEPGKLTMSGAKVNSFFANLIGVTDEVTQDTWMARYMGLEQITSGGVKGKAITYKAMNAVTREAAKIVSERTGQEWTPAEVQETVWSFAKSIYEAVERDPYNRSAEQLLEQAGLTHAAISRTPDFGVLFSDAVFKRILEEGGYGQQANIGSDGRTVQLDGEASVLADSEGSGLARDAYEQFVKDAARRVTRNLELRRAAREDTGQGELVFNQDVSPEQQDQHPERQPSRPISPEMLRRIMRGGHVFTYNQEVTPSEEVFYSNAERAVAEAKQEKASADQWAALLTPGRTPGIKAEEIEWTGILDWLKMQKGPIEKGALLQVLRDRGIKVDEVVLGEPQPDRKDRFGVKQVNNEFYTVRAPDSVFVSDVPDEDKEGPFATYAEAVRATERLNDLEFERSDPVRFQSWSSDPNNPTYRELLITLPQGQGSNPERAPSTHWDTDAVVAHVRFMVKQDAEGNDVLFVEEVQSDWHQKGRDQGYETPATPEQKAKIDEAAKTLREAEETLSEINSDIARNEQEVTAKIGPYLIAAYEKSVADVEERAKTNDKLTPEAVQAFKDVMRNQTGMGFFEHYNERGDQGGYVGYDTMRGWIAAAKLDLPRELGDRMADIEKLLGERRDASWRVELRRRELNVAQEGASRGIPDAPFKSSWPALVMKRTIRWAVDHGITKIAWTTGEEQAARYNLSAATGPIRITAHKDDGYLVNMNSDAKAHLLNNQLATRQSSVSITDWVVMTEAQLKEAFGADVANRLIDGVEAINLKEGEALYRQAVKDRNAASDAVLAARKKDLETNSPEDRARTDELQRELDKQTKIANALRTYHTFTLDGEGLNVGGEGMKAFYDRNLVNITNGIIKKYGAKVEVMRVKGEDPQRAALVNKLATDFGLATYGLGSSAEAEARIEEYKRNIERGVGDTDKAGEWIADIQAAMPIIKKIEVIDANPGVEKFGFTITPKLAEAASSGFPLFQQKRGNITIARDEQGLMKSAVIRAFEAANFSTAVHELGHFFLEDLKRRALRSDATDAERADWQSFKDWAASLGHEIDDNAAIPVAAHEYFARGMERFVYEGNAPSRGLRAIFTKMREFMLELYKTATSFNAPITPEIRQVMGRMLASQQELDEQANDMKLASEAVKGLLTEAEQKAYDDLAAEGRQDARDKLFASVLSSLKRQRQEVVREQKTAIVDDVTGKVDSNPVYRALRVLRIGIPNAEGGLTRAKLDEQQLVDRYGPDILDQLPKGVPPLVATNDTMDMDHIAEIAGLDSGDQLVKALVAHEAERRSMREQGDKRSPRQREIDDAVEARVQQELGDPFAHLEEEAQAALANNLQEELMSMELRAIGRKTGKKPTPWKMAKEWAKTKLEGQNARDAISGQAMQRYARAVARAGQEAEDALVKGDFEEAFQWKQRQLLNMALMQEAKKLTDEVDAAVRRLQKLAKRDTIPSVDQNYLDQVHALLEDVDLRDRSGVAVDKRMAFEQWYQAQVALGIEPVIPPEYRSLLGKTHWTKLLIPELLELDKAAKQIVELGRLKQKLKDGKAQRDFDEGVAEMQGSAETQPARKRGQEINEARSLPARARSILRTVDAGMIKIEQLCSWLDGGDPNGPWSRYLFRPLAEAQGRETDLMRGYVEKINALIKSLPKAQVKGWLDKVDTPELVIRNMNSLLNGQAPVLHKDEVVMMAMNWGNDGNRQRLLDGYGWDEAAVQQVLDRVMTKEDWDFVQQVWDIVDSLWPEIAALEKRVNGLAPEKVESVVVNTPHGQYRGGYFPIIYDPTQSTKAAIDEENKLAPEGGFMMATTRASATKQRAAAVKGRPLLLSMGVITRHLGEVIHDITHREAVMQAKKLLGDSRVNGAINNRLGPEYFKAFGSWIENIARPGTAYSKEIAVITKVGRHLNKAVSMVGLGFRFTTAAVQLLGIPIAAKETGEKHLAVALGTVIAHPVKSYNEIIARSAEMRGRFQTLDATIEDMMHEQANGKLKTIGPKGLQKYAFQAIAYMDFVVTTVVWTAGFNKGLEQGMTEEEAALYGDKLVRTTQGTGGQKDRSGIQNASPAVRSFYPFFSYLNALYNMQRDVFRQYRNASSARDYAEATRQAWWVFIVPMLLQSLFFGPGPDDPEDATYADWASYLVKSIILGNLGSIPLIGNLASAIGDGYSYRSSAYQQIGEGAVKAFNDTKKFVEGDTELKGSVIKSTLNTVGLILAQPLGQIGTTAGGIYDYSTGQADPQTAGDWYELIAKGRVPDHPNAAQQLVGKKT